MADLHPPSLLQNLILLVIASLPLIIIVIVVIVLFKKIISNSSHSNTKRVAKALLITIVSIIIVLSSLNLPKTMYNPKDLINITCGWPLPFIEFDSWKNPPKGWTDSCIGWGGSPMDINLTFFWDGFILNVITVFSVLGGGIYLIQKFYKGKKKHL